MILENPKTCPGDTINPHICASAWYFRTRVKTCWVIAEFPGSQSRSRQMPSWRCQITPVPHRYQTVVLKLIFLLWLMPYGVVIIFFSGVLPPQPGTFNNKTRLSVFRYTLRLNNLIFLIPSDYFLTILKLLHINLSLQQTWVEALSSAW